MSLTLSQMVTRVMRNLQLPVDSTASSTQAQTDIAQFINERASDVWSRRNWPEYIILGHATVAAGTTRIALSDITVETGFNTAANGYGATFYGFVSVRNGTTNIYAEDPGVIQRLQADLWQTTNSPQSFINRGQSGMILLGQFTAPTTLYFYGKATTQDLSNSETWILENDAALISGATGDMIKFHDRDDNRAAINYQEYEAEIAKMIDAVDNQMGNIKRIVPSNPWTASFSRKRNFTVTGVNNTTYR